MINANELRSGNWVMYSGKRCTVMSIFGGTQNLIVGRGGINPYAYVEKVDPIPLTPEMLGKMGFVDNNGVYKIPYLRHLETTVRQHLFSMEYPENCKRWAIGVENLAQEIKIAIANIEYVHQLQNLIFALTGKEIAFEL